MNKYIHITLCNCAVNEQIHTHNTRENKDYYRYGHNLELYNSKPSVVGCIFYNKLKKLNSMVCVRERTIPTERPPLVGEVIANFCG
jgi:hypothetical protein